MCEALAAAPSRERCEITLPGSRRLPLRLVIVGDLRGELSSMPIDRRPLQPIDAATFDAVRTTFAPLDMPEVNALWAQIRELCAKVAACGRTDVMLGLFELPFQDVAEDFMDEGVMGSALSELIVRRPLAAPGEVPVDACLFAWRAVASDQAYFDDIERILARGPVQAFGAIPSQKTYASGLFVHADPFAAGRSIIDAYVRSGWVERLEGYPEAIGATFALSRLARHAASIHLAASAQHRTLAVLEGELLTWLRTNAGPNAPVRDVAVLIDDPPPRASRHVSCTFAGVVGKAKPTVVRPTLFRWPVSRDTRLWTYAFAYTSSPESPTLQIASRPFAAVISRLDEGGVVQVLRLTETIEPLGIQGVFPLHPRVIDRLQKVPPAAVIFASAAEAPLDAAKLEALAAPYAFFRASHGTAFSAVLQNHPAFAEWLP